MRKSYLVCYDVRDPKRLRKVHKVMKAYGEAWQYSVFWCTLKAIDRVRMEGDLREVANLRQDQVLILDMGTNEWSISPGIHTDIVCWCSPASPRPYR